MHDQVKWYKIAHAGEQVAQWDFQNKGRCIVLEVTLCNLLTSMCDFVPCDLVVQRVYSEIVSLMLLLFHFKTGGNSPEHSFFTTEWTGAEASLFRVLRPIYCNNYCSIANLIHSKSCKEVSISLLTSL